MRDGFVKVCACVPRISVADVDANVNSIINKMQEAAANDAQICAFPMLCITGATCGDLFLQDSLLNAAYKGLLNIKAASGALETIFVVGLPFRVDDCLVNAAAIVYRGDIIAIVPQSEYQKKEILDLDRYFTPFMGDAGQIEIDGDKVLFGSDILVRIPAVDSLTMGIVLGSDGYDPAGPMTERTKNGATFIIHMDANPELVSTEKYRMQRIETNTHLTLSNLLYVNAGYGESTTDYVFSGQCVIAECGEIIAKNEAFGVDGDEYGRMLIEDLDIGRVSYERKRIDYTEHHFTDGLNIVAVDLLNKPIVLTRKFAKNPFIPDDEASRRDVCSMILRMQAEGLRKRIEHTKVSGCVIGISGGLDSTLALLVTVKAFKLLNKDVKDIVAVTMPCFGTTQRTKSNAVTLATSLGCTVREVNISNSVTMHLKDIGHDVNDTNVTYENAQARERTQVLMDIANDLNALVVGTGDLSELALGWCTYNGDHMSMYAVNAGIPKTMLRFLVDYYADECCGNISEASKVLKDVLLTPVSPELLPPKDGEISQCTEDIVGPYELHDFFLYYCLRWGYSPKKIYRMAQHAFDGEYDDETILKWEKKFYWRFVSQQFKRSCMPDGPKIGSVGLSPRGDLNMPSDATANVWIKELEEM